MRYLSCSTFKYICAIIYVFVCDILSLCSTSKYLCAIIYVLILCAMSVLLCDIILLCATFNDVRWIIRAIFFICAIIKYTCAFFAMGIRSFEIVVRCLKKFYLRSCAQYIFMCENGIVGYSMVSRPINTEY